MFCGPVLCRSTESMYNVIYGMFQLQEHNTADNIAFNPVPPHTAVQLPRKVEPNATSAMFRLD